MYSLKINSERDINNRQASNFVYNISALHSDIWITKNDRRINAKSILGVLSINIQKGDLIELSFSEENKKEITMVVNEFKN